MNRITTLLTAFAVAAATWSPGIARADAWYECQADQVLEQSNRVSVRCKSSFSINGNSVSFFAIDKTDVARASRFISMGTSAVLAAQVFLVYAPDSTATNTSGCASDCRTPSSFGLRFD